MSSSPLGMSLSMVLAKPSVSDGSPTDHNHHRRTRPKCLSPIIAEHFLDFEAGVAEQQAQFAGKEDVTLNVIEKSFDAAPMLVLLVHEPNLSALFVLR